MITKICSIFKKVLIFLHKLSIYEKKYEASTVIKILSLIALILSCFSTKLP